MHNPSAPAEENARLAALAACNLLDTEAEPAFDAITEVAAFVCQTPIALISLVDRDRQWFKAAKGMDGVTETHRDVSFCAHAVAQKLPLEVNDACLDARFTHNELVTGPFGLRFYCGIPLVTKVDGQAIGTLCVIDRVPRLLAEEQQQALEHLAVATTALIDLRRG